ncbi:hypothetical protein QYE76_012520 [Lolium multiflorum]|uniref:Uncharacterized protein n=1 Tax=Lolium multiflorum TaxID=4521 RepID=A0AAD8X3Q9_LOLMU|nr:hypothetical protein QYE76_012520 [Lolium multiflorum]
MTIPRHLAPTVGPSASAAGVFIRTGLTTTTGERVASGLIWRFGSLDCVSDNAGCFADRPFPAGGNIISRRPTSTSPPSHHRATRAILCAAQALPLEPAPASPPAPASCRRSWPPAHAGDKSTRVRGPRVGAHQQGFRRRSGPRAPAPPSRLDEVQAKLSSPLTAGADPSSIEKDLETHRQLLLMQRKNCLLQSGRWRSPSASTTALTASPAGDNPSRAGHIRRRGGGLGAEIARDGAESPAPSMEPPVYNTPDKNMRAAQAAAEELSRLQGEELRRQTKRVTELLNAATKQSADPSRTSRPPSGNSGRSRPPSSRRDEEEYERPSTIKHRAAPEASGQRQPAHSRLGPRIEPTDARDRLDRLVESRITEEEGPAGPKCFGPRILNEPMIDGFQLPRDTPYGTAKPEDWLQDYSTAVGIAKATSAGRPNETDRAYLTRWCEMRNSCEGVHEIQAVGFFMAGCRPNTMLWHKLRRSDPKTMAALMAIADNRRDNYRGKRHSDQPDRRYGSAHVAAVSDHAAAGGSRRQKQTDRPWKPKYTFEQMLDSPCKYHSGKNPSNHTTRDCHFMKRLTSGEPLPPPPPPPPAGGPGGQAGAEANNLEHHEANQVHHGGRYLAEDATYIIFTTEPEDKTSQQRRSLEVNAVMPPVPQYLNCYAMVLDPTIGTSQRSVRFSRVLIDGGSSINILYRDTARKLGIQEAELRPTPTVFHGIVPGHSCQPIGRITLAVMFGKPDNFRTENVEFEVVDLVSPYHALLGRPALTKFMAVPHYGYLKMKLPGPKGVITVAGDYRRSMECATQSSKMAQTLVIAAEKQLISDAVAMAKAAQSGMPAVGNPAGTTHFQPANDTKKILLDPAQPDKFVTIGAGLSSK